MSIMETELFERRIEALEKILNNTIKEYEEKMAMFIEDMVDIEDTYEYRLKVLEETVEFILEEIEEIKQGRF